VHEIWPVANPRQEVRSHGGFTMQSCSNPMDPTSGHQDLPLRMVNKLKE